MEKVTGKNRIGLTVFGIYTALVSGLRISMALGLKFPIQKTKIDYSDHVFLAYIFLLLISIGVILRYKLARIMMLTFFPCMGILFLPRLFGIMVYPVSEHDVCAFIGNTTFLRGVRFADDPGFVTGVTGMLVFAPLFYYLFPLFYLTSPNIKKQFR